MNRRTFVKKSILGSAALATMSVTRYMFGQMAGDPYRGLKVGVASYSFRKFSLSQTIAMTRELGLKYISLKDVHLPRKSTVAERRAARKEIEAAGLRLMGGGVIYLSAKPEEIEDAFRYASDAGMPTIISSPDPAGLDMVEAMAKKYDIRVAIHNHGPTVPRFVSPRDAWEAVQHRDARLGLCVDVGHVVRNSEDPVEALKHYASRVYDVHIKDVAAMAPRAEDRIVGQGIIDIPGVFRALLDMKFDGHVEMEFELTPDNPLPGMQESLAFIRATLARQT